LHGPDHKPIRSAHQISWSSRHGRRYAPMVPTDPVARETGLRFPTQPGVGIKKPSEFYSSQYTRFIFDIFGSPARILSRTAYGESSNR
jgi:hypothetical protein